MQAGSDDRRHSKRIRFPCEARCYGVGESLPDAHLSDLSTSGAFVETALQLPLGSIVILRFEAAGERVKLEAEVVRSDPPHGLGVRFVSLDPHSRAVIGRVGVSG